LQSAVELLVIPARADPWMDRIMYPDGSRLLPSAAGSRRRCKSSALTKSFSHRDDGSRPVDGGPETVTVEPILAGDRRALARAVTLVESTRPRDRDRAEALLAALMPHTGSALRLGVSGAPGVGKSTFIEAFGRHAIAGGDRVAVLAVDPSSSRSGGSILGDKTRMEALAADPRAFVRPSPAGSAGGGVAARTSEAILLCEAAGFSLVIVETVGVGQTDFAVASMVDVFLLLLQPGAGDELQGIKRGIVEIADILAVTKADGASEGAARHAVADYRQALGLLRPAAGGWQPPVLAVSAAEGRGIAEIRDAIERFRAHQGPAGIAARRAGQAEAALWRDLVDGLMRRLGDAPGFGPQLAEAQAAVAAGEKLPATAARHLLDAFAARP
jgi:LAO/AO transport system kinase